MEVPELGDELELQLPVYATAMCNLCHSLRQHQILNPLSEAKD